MASISGLSNKKLYFLRYLSYWLYVVFTLCIPVMLIAWQFEIFHKPEPVNTISLTAYGIIAILIVAFIFRGHLSRAIAEMEPCIFKSVLINIGKLIPWIFFWFILTFITSSIEKIKFILFWAVIGNLFAMFIDLWHTMLLKECKNRGK